MAGSAALPVTASLGIANGGQVQLKCAAVALHVAFAESVHGLQTGIGREDPRSESALLDNGELAFTPLTKFSQGRHTRHFHHRTTEMQGPGEQRRPVTGGR